MKNKLCNEELYTITSQGFSIFSDITAFHGDSRTGLIIENTIRFETNN